MASQFIHFPDEDFAILRWTGTFEMDACLKVFSAYLLQPATTDIIDIRRLFFSTIKALDLFQLAQRLKATSLSGAYRPGKTAIVAGGDEAISAPAVIRELCHFMAWAEANQLPRELKLFRTMAAAHEWLGVLPIDERWTD